MDTDPGRSGFVLVVEDDDDLRESLAELLRLSAFPVVTAANGREAQDVLQGPARPALVLLDLMMPIMSGWELARWMHAEPTLVGVPIVAMTGVANPAEEARNIGAATWIAKPLDLPLLFTTLARMWPTHDEGAEARSDG